jgi:Uma2 family endonuclease
MTLAPRLARHRYSYDEYLAYERDSGMKHEYDGGEIVAMTGGSRRHNALASRSSAALENARKPGCFAFQSDQRIRVLATGKATYPDASMEYHDATEGTVQVMSGAVLDLARLYTHLPD